MKTKGIIKSIAAIAVLSTVLLQQGWIQASAIEKNADVNEENILELLNEYDPDGAYIIEFAIENGGNVLSWFNEKSTIIDDISTAVHEETHEYIMQNYRDDEEEIYVGNKNSIHVTYTEVFDSQEMTSDIPEELQTFRFDTYVGNPDENMASNIRGVYGLLNEFTAYCWDLNNTICLYDYYKTEANSDSDWLDYVNKLQNGRMAYSEFNFYILKYLEYAQNNYPEIYQDIIANESFTEAYTTIESKYHSLVETGDMYIDEIRKDKNGEIENGYFYIGSSGISINDEDYNKLINETGKNEYQVIYNAIGGTGVPLSTAASSSAAALNGTSTNTTTAASSTTYSYSSNISSTGSGEEKETSLFTVGNIVLLIMWIASITGISVILIELMRARKKK